MTDGRKAAYMPRRHIAAPGPRAAAAHRCAVRPADTPRAVMLEVSTAGPQGPTPVVKGSGEIDLPTAQALQSAPLDPGPAGFPPLRRYFRGLPLLCAPRPLCRLPA